MNPRQFDGPYMSLQPGPQLLQNNLLRRLGLGPQEHSWYIQEIDDQHWSTIKFGSKILSNSWRVYLCWLYIMSQSENILILPTLSYINCLNKKWIYRIPWDLPNPLIHHHVPRKNLFHSWGRAQAQPDQRCHFATTLNKSQPLFDSLGYTSNQVRGIPQQLVGVEGTAQWPCSHSFWNVVSPIILWNLGWFRIVGVTLGRNLWVA